MRRLIVLGAVLLAACSNPPSEPRDETAVQIDRVRVADAPVERRIFIFRAAHKPRHQPGGRESGSSCFSFLANGAKWKVQEPYSTTFSIPVATWEFEDNIFGAGSIVGSVPVFTGNMDGLNTAQFAPYSEPGVLAVTVVWGIFRGPPRGRELLEWDLLMNTNFSWGDAAADSTLFDTEGVAAHELGHALGLGHPDDSCTEETMFRFASVGETKKRTLESGDIAGARDLY